jgi:hypothetical protein
MVDDSHRQSIRYWALAVQRALLAMLHPSNLSRMVGHCDL